MDVQEIKGRMAASVRMVLGRALNSTANFNQSTANSLSVAATANQSGMGEMGDATQRLIFNLVFAESKSVRTSTIILAAFNVLAAFATAASILYDCYWASKRCNPKFKASKFCVHSIHPAETFPLVISVGIFIQGIVFAGVQGQGLQALFTNGCREIAQFMWPALFIVPYLQLVFGLECTIRSLGSTPFRARGKYDVAICCGVVVLMLIVTWIPSHIFPEPDVCFASLVWFISRFGEWGFVLLSAATGIMVLSALTIFYKLSTVNIIDQHQRIAASRMVYYLVVGIVSLAFVLPYFFSLIYREGDIKLAMMATVVLNLSGLMSGLLQLFLRSNTATTSFGPKSGTSWDRSKHDIRIFGPNELAIQIQLANPVTGPRTPRTPMEDPYSRSTSRASLIGPEKGEEIRMDTLHSPLSPKMQDEMQPMTPSSEPSTPPKIASPPRGHSRKPSYSLFPPGSTSPKSTQKPTSVYDITDLEPPPAIHFTRGIRHKRDSSIASSATVQIGLRISHAPAPQAPSQEDISNLPLPLPSTTYNAKPLAPKNPMLSPLPLQPTTYSANKPPASRPLLPPSPLRVNTSFTAAVRQASPILEASPNLPLRSPRRPSPLMTSIQTESPTRAAINKTLPPTPKAFLPSRESNTQLSPAVYSPEKKIPAPTSAIRGPLSATLPRKNPLGANSVGSPLSRSNSAAKLSLAERDGSPVPTKSDWI